MGQMRITWVAGDSVDRHGGLTDSLLAHGHHHLWTSPCPPQPACLGREGPPLCWAGVRAFVGAGEKFVEPRKVL